MRPEPDFLALARSALEIARGVIADTVTAHNLLTACARQPRPEVVAETAQARIERLAECLAAVDIALAELRRRQRSTGGTDHAA